VVNINVEAVETEAKLVVLNSAVVGRPVVAGWVDIFVCVFVEESGGNAVGACVDVAAFVPLVIEFVVEPLTVACSTVVMSILREVGGVDSMCVELNTAVVRCCVDVILATVEECAGLVVVE